MNEAAMVMQNGEWCDTMIRNMFRVVAMKNIGPLSRSAGFMLVLVCAAFTACHAPRSAPISPALTPGDSRSKPEVRSAELEKHIHILVNGERKKHGLSPLAWNEALSGIACKHSSDMAKKGYFSHVSPVGHDFSYRYKQEGYQCEVRGQGNVYYTGAENIFQNNLFDRVMISNGVRHYEWNSVDRIAETTVDGWMKSPGHRKNILMPYWVSEGIGVSISADGKVYITQNFC
jgi:uncharacterized protein YkwD